MAECTYSPPRQPGRDRRAASRPAQRASPLLRAPRARPPQLTRRAPPPCSQTLCVRTPRRSAAQGRRPSNAPRPCVAATSPSRTSRSRARRLFFGTCADGLVQVRREHAAHLVRRGRLGDLCARLHGPRDGQAPRVRFFFHPWFHCCLQHGGGLTHTGAPALALSLLAVKRSLPRPSSS